MDDRTPLWLRVAVVVAGSFVWGGVTSYAQTYLPESLASFANSVSGWTMVTVVVVWLVRPRVLVGACLGALSFVSLVLGYTLVAELRGFAYSPVFWSVVGIIGGPFVGAAAAALRRRRVEAAVGSGLLAGVFISEGIYGLTVVDDTTSPVYWTLAIIVGFVVVATVAATRLRAVRPIALQIAMTLAAVTASRAAYAVINAV